jgi:16S rRNA (guanine527-N7)-methyltransferase
MADDAALLAALAFIRDRGAIGEASLLDAVAHADRFVAHIPAAATSLVDLGSGGGLPGLVIAWRRPDLAVTLVERRESRADLLRRAVSTLKLGSVTVAATDVRDLAAAVGPVFEVVTARSFADPAATIAAVVQLLAPDGVALISEPPVDRAATWAAALRRADSLRDGGVEQGIRRLLHVAHG